MEFDPAELAARESGRFPMQEADGWRARLYRGREQLQRLGWAAQLKGASMNRAAGAMLARRPLATLGAVFGVALLLGFAAGRIGVSRTRTEKE